MVMATGTPWIVVVATDGVFMKNRKTLISDYD
jgi:hypothetical protein